MKFFHKVLSYFSEIVFVEVQSFSQACKLHIDHCLTAVLAVIVLCQSMFGFVVDCS